MSPFRHKVVKVVYGPPAVMDNQVNKEFVFTPQKATDEFLRLMEQMGCRLRVSFTKSQVYGRSWFSLIPKMVGPCFLWYFFSLVDPILFRSYSQYLKIIIKIRLTLYFERYGCWIELLVDTNSSTQLKSLFYFSSLHFLYLTIVQENFYILWETFLIWCER